MSYENVGKAAGEALQVMAIVLLITIPLAIWKIIELVIWAFSHLSIGIK